jgi:hypothetical protein
MPDLDPTKPAQAQSEPETVDEQPWASPMDGEDAKWFHRASLYFAMGACRSVRAVYNAELAERGRGSSVSKSVPSTWHKASQGFEWKRRAQAFDEWRRKEVFNAGNAQDTERIKKLDELINKLSERCLDLLDTMVMEIVRPEDATKLIAALLSAIDLMAKHTGGYAASRVEHTGKDGKAIEIEHSKVDVVFYVPEIDALEDAPGPSVQVEDVQRDEQLGPVSDNEGQ